MAGIHPKQDDIVIAGAGMVPVGEHWDMSLRSLGWRAINAAIKDSGGLQPQALYAGSQIAGLASHQNNLSTLLVDNSGLGGIENFTVEASGASGAGAARMAYLAVSSGYVDTALVVGLDKFTDRAGTEAQQAAAHGADYEYEVTQGVTPAIQASMLTQRYIHENDLSPYVLEDFTRIARHNGQYNPAAYHYKRPYRMKGPGSPGMRFDPSSVTLGMAPYADGAAALLVTRRELLPEEFPHPVVRMTASSVIIDTLALHDRSDPLVFEAAGLSIQEACRKSGILPSDVDFLELDDSYAILAALALEAGGFAQRGGGHQLASNGTLEAGGKLPVSTMGGYLGRGNPLGAGGVYQIVEAVMQLRGIASQCQVTGAQRALVQSLGGPATTAITHILERVS